MSPAERSVFPGFETLDRSAAEAARIGRLLADERTTQGLSQSEIAARMGTSQPAIARLESGSTNARLSTLVRYAEALGCAVDFTLAPADDA